MKADVRDLLDAIRAALEARVEPRYLLGALDYVLDADGDLGHAAGDLRALAQREDATP